jgi:hypothetical protein
MSNLARPRDAIGLSFHPSLPGKVISCHLGSHGSFSFFPLLVPYFPENSEGHFLANPFRLLHASEFAETTILIA